MVLMGILVLSISKYALVAFDTRSKLAMYDLCVRWKFSDNKVVIFMRVSDTRYILESVNIFK